MKRIVLTIIFALMTTQLAFCATETFRIGATIPQIPGVNYFPEEADLKTSAKQDVIKQLVMRNGKEMMLQTSVVK